MGHCKDGASVPFFEYASGEVGCFEFGGVELHDRLYGRLGTMVGGRGGAL